MTSALLVLLLLSASTPGDQGPTGCWRACQRHVQEPALRARVCALCVSTGRPDSWVLELGQGRGGAGAEAALRSALTDPDWHVRWAALRARARAEGQREPRVLADWVVAAPARDEASVCLTAARAAASAGRSPAAFLQDAGAHGPAAAARVWAHRDAVREALEVEVYAEDVAPRAEALLHLATFQGISPARALLGAMSRRPESGDAVAASVLLAVAERQGASVGRMLLLEARPPDQTLINRLFAVYSQSLEALHKPLASADVQERHAAVQELRRYGPLAQRELEHALLDTDSGVSRAAARGLAEAEGWGVLEAARRHVHEAGTPLAARRVWLELARTDRGCEPFLLELARDPQLAADTRGEAVAGLSECVDTGSRLRFQTLAPFLADAQPRVRAGAVRALVPARMPESGTVLAAALGDPAPEVVAAALERVGPQPAQVDTVLALLGSPEAAVREAAVRALARLGRPQFIKPLAQTLREDSMASVRVAAAEALGMLGGPIAASALSEALARDGDSHVQHVARRGLERLGFSPP